MRRPIVLIAWWMTSGGVLHAAAEGKTQLRDELQRGVDARLLKIEASGIEGCGLFTGRVHVARSAREAQRLSDTLAPGDQLLLAGTNWSGARFKFGGRGTAEAPILVRPEQPGDAVFAGAAELSFHGSHLIVSGLTFKEAVPGADGAVLLRLGAREDKPADHCLVHRVTFENCGSKDSNDWPRVRMWLMTVRGSDNTVANGTFSGFRNHGQMLGAANLPTGGLQRLHVLNNVFRDRPKIDRQNGYEIIQIGWSGEKAKSAGALIQGNTFEQCNGEGEIITLKASDIFVRSNAFLSCEGALCLRQADRVLVEGNHFDGRHRPDTGGVRIQGAGHVVVGNTFRNLGKPGNYYNWTISLMAADAEASGATVGYGRARDILIAANRFETNATRIAAGIYPRPEYPLLPKNVRAVGNLFVGGPAGGVFDYVAPDATGGLKAELHEERNGFRP